MSDEASPPNPNPPTSHEVTPHDQQAGQVQQFMTVIKNPAEQVGEHIITALQQPDTVAILTTVAVGPDGKQRVISAALDPARMRQVQELLSAASEEREIEEPCVGFHCMVKPKSND
ncbi:MAG: hypothetical protein AAFX06_17190 [Planctomycetota bacterium]